MRTKEERELYDFVCEHSHVIYSIWVRFESVFYFKVGYSGSFLGRQEIITSGLPESPFYYFLISSGSREGAQVMERQLKANLKPYRTKGEWHSSDDLYELVCAWANAIADLWGDCLHWGDFVQVQGTTCDWRSGNDNDAACFVDKFIGSRLKLFLVESYHKISARLIVHEMNQAFADYTGRKLKDRASPYPLVDVRYGADTHLDFLESMIDAGTMAKIGSWLLDILYPDGWASGDEEE